MYKTNVVLAGIVAVLCVAVVILGVKWRETDQKLQVVLAPLPEYDPTLERIQDNDYQAVLKTRSDEQRALAMEGEALQHRLRRVIDETAAQSPELQNLVALFNEAEEAFIEAQAAPVSQERGQAISELRQQLLYLARQQREFLENQGSDAYRAVMADVADHTRRVEEHQRGSERAISQRMNEQNDARRERERLQEERMARLKEQQ